MRVVGRVPHPSITITLFEYNEKFTIKLEAGPMEQSYKIATETVGNVADLQKLADSVFLNECLEHFNAMFISWKATTDRNLSH